MDKMQTNIQNTQTIFSLISILEQNKKMMEKKQIINWIKEDLEEISQIQKQLKEMKLLCFAYKIKKVTDMAKIEQYLRNKDITKIYLIVNNELNVWRDIKLTLHICYSQLRISLKGGKK